MILLYFWVYVTLLILFQSGKLVRHCHTTLKCGTAFAVPAVPVVLPLGPLDHFRFTLDMLYGHLDCARC